MHSSLDAPGAVLDTDRHVWLSTETKVDLRERRRAPGVNADSDEVHHDI